MAATAPSALFESLADVWRHLALRSDPDNVILELLGHFSLEKIYAAAGEREAYQNLVIALLAQLNAVFYVQRLTLPAENLPVGWYVGLLASWEVTLRSVEFALQIVVEGRESLWEARQLRDKYLAEFLLSALRVLTLHPKPPANQRAKDRRDRFARVQRAVEQVFDSYPGQKSFLLEVCKEVANHLHEDPNALALPQRLKYELPNLASELYPLPECLLPPSISELVVADDFTANWLSQFLALRDVAHFVVGASIQYSVNRETRDVRLQSSSARSRNAILDVIDSLRLPPHLSKRDVVAIFSATFRVILPDTLDLSRRDSAESHIDEYEIDALDNLCNRLRQRETINRVSDRELMHNVSQVVRDVLLLDDPSNQARPARPALYAVNCAQCHLVGGSQLKSSDIRLPSDVSGSEIAVAPESRCLQCHERISLLREVPLARRTWELLRPLEPDADTVNLERHLPSQFQLSAPRIEAGGLFNPGYGAMSSSDPRLADSELYPSQGRGVSPDPFSPDRNRSMSQALLSPQSPERRLTPNTQNEPFRWEGSTYVGTRQLESGHDAPPFTPREPPSSTAPPMSPGTPGFRHQSHPLGASPMPTAKTIPILSQPEKEKGKSKWRMFGSKKAPTGHSGDTSSLSSTTLESQKLEEIPLSALSTTSSKSSRSKTTKNINVYLSPISTLALFWNQLSIHVWDAGTSPPTMVRAISTESACLLAAVGRKYLAYIIGTRDQKLTLRIVDLVQPSSSVVEFRVPSTPWCKSIAIDRRENYVVVGFEQAMARFFKVTNNEAPRVDRLHSALHDSCKGCPSVDTLSFSSDGLILLASTRSPKTGLIQLYAWRFPFVACQELRSCRYPVPLHESEDNGISSAVVRSHPDDESNLICITTWTQSGTPVLIQPQDGYKSEIKLDPSSRHGKLGSRIQCAAFSPSGRELAMINDKGYLYQISNLNSSPMDIRRLATSKELTAKSESFAMSFMMLSEDESIVLAWADSARATGWIKKIPLTLKETMNVPETPAARYASPSRPDVAAELPGVDLPSELPAGSSLQPEPLKIPRKPLKPSGQES